MGTSSPLNKIDGKLLSDIFLKVLETKHHFHIVVLFYEVVYVLIGKALKLDEGSNVECEKTFPGFDCIVDLRNDLVHNCTKITSIHQCASKLCSTTLVQDICDYCGFKPLVAGKVYDSLQYVSEFYEVLRDGGAEAAVSTTSHFNK